MSFSISIPNLDSSDTEIVFELGCSTIFVGANGSDLSAPKYLWR